MEKLRRLPDSELEVMLVIWNCKPPIHTGEILQQLGDNKKGNLQMVQSYLNRLVEKGFIKCNKIGRLNHYSALVDPEEYRAQEASSFLEKLYENSPTKLFATLLRNNSLSAADIAEMKKILEESEA